MSAMQRLASAFVLCAAALACGTAAVAQEYPTRPIRVLVPWPAATPPDVVTRIVATKVSQTIGQPVVVENRPGAGGTVGLQEFMRLPADGYNVMQFGVSQTLTPVLYPRVTVDLRKDLAPIILLDSFDNVLVVGPESPFRTVNDLVGTLKAKPGALTFGSAGNGTPAHLSGEVLKQETRSFAVHLPYNVFPQAIGDVIAGRLDFMFLAAAAAVPQIRGGKLRPLAVTGAERLPWLKDVPTMREQGFPEFVVSSWGSLVTHASVPAPVIARLNAEFGKALAAPEVRDALDKIASVPLGGTPARLGETIDREITRWGRLARERGIKAD